VVGSDYRGMANAGARSRKNVVGVNLGCLKQLHDSDFKSQTITGWKRGGEKREAKIRKRRAEPKQLSGARKTGILQGERSDM